MDVNIILFDDFDSLDAFGPADIFGRAKGDFHINYLSVEGNIVNSMQGIKIWTEKLVPASIRGIVIIPGGNGARRLVFQDENTVQIIKHAADKAEICMMIGSGVSVLAQSGLLYRRKVADCDIDQNWRRLFMGGVSVVKDAIWVSDGKFYSSSNTMNGIDMALAIVADYMDVDTALYVAKQIGYNWDPNDVRAYI